MGRQSIGQKLNAVLGPRTSRVLIVVPPETPPNELIFEVAVNRRYPCFPPYGGGLLATHLMLSEYETSILDLNYEMLNHAHRSKSEAEFDPNIWRVRLSGALEKFKPDCLALSCMFTMAHPSLKDVAQLVRSLRPGLPILAGGVHVTNATEMVLRDIPEIDFAISHEADRSFVTLLEFVNGRAKVDALEQVSTLIDSQYVKVDSRAAPVEQHLDRAPSYLKLDIGNYDNVGQVGFYTFMRSGRKAATVLGNRGCRAQCTFCSVRSFNGAGVRSRSVGSVVDEIERLASDYGIKHVMWLDDDLFYNQQRTVNLFDELSRRNLDVTWDATNGVIAAAITPEIMDAAVKSGCVGMTLGIESGNPKILRSVRKPETVEAFRRAADILRGYSQVFFRGFLMMGFPGETLRQLMDTVNLALEMDLDWYSITVLTPLPSTTIYRTMVEQGLVEDDLAPGSVRFQSGAHGSIGQREQRERTNAVDFFNLLAAAQVDRVPTAAELKDLWFVMDYRINHEKLLTLDHAQKLRHQGDMLLDICDRVTTGNALCNLSVAVIEQKLGNLEESRKRVAMTEEYVATSEYWQKRFASLDIYSVLTDLKEKLSTQESSTTLRAA